MCGACVDSVTCTSRPASSSSLSHAAQGPFNTFVVDHPNRNLQFNNLAFSPDGKMLLLNSREGFLGLMDSFTGAIVRECALELRVCLVSLVRSFSRSTARTVLSSAQTCTYTGFSNAQGVALDACFSPDGSLVMSGAFENVGG